MARIVKNHVYFKKIEDYDQKNFKFGRTMVHFRERETLGEKREGIKDLLLGGLIREKKEVETDGFVKSLLSAWFLTNSSKYSLFQPTRKSKTSSKQDLTSRKVRSCLPTHSE